MTDSLHYFGDLLPPLDLSSDEGMAGQDGSSCSNRLQRFADLDAPALMRAVIRDIFPGRIALVSSFGAESAILLHMAAEVDRNTPVIFLDTGKLFPETLAYRDALVDALGLRDVRSAQPDRGALEREDTYGELWRIEPDRCCEIRKVEPLQRALTGFEAWITGRKRFQGGLRRALPTIEAEGDSGRVKVNPLAGWSRDRIEAHFEATGLPRHPLEASGYRSLGCIPCTEPAASSDDPNDPRAGRWRGRSKVECGIHLSRKPRPSAA